MSSTGCTLQPAGYEAIQACHPPAEQEATSRVCGRLSALYCCGFLLDVFVSDPGNCKYGVCTVVRYVHAAKHTTLVLLVLVLLVLVLQRDFRGQPSVVESSSPLLGASFSISVNNIKLNCTAVFR